MIRIGEWSQSIVENRKRFWCEELKLSLKWVDFSEAQLQDPVALLKTRDVDAVLTPISASEPLLQASSKIPTEVREAGLVDAVVRLQGQMWIRCYVREALHQLILKTAPQLDTHAIVYVTGSDAQARMCAAVAVRMGFQKLVLISENQNEAQEIGNQISKHFFNLDFKYLKETELTLQPNNGSLLLNTLSEETGGIVFEDLTYLNFLRKDGLVVHLPFGSNSSNALLEEAAHVGIRHLAATEICGLKDFLFLQELGLITQKSDDYLAQWQRFLSKPEKVEKQT